MNFSDEQLSAFLDAELPEAEMAIIRDAIAGDDELASRLADLAAVDTLVRDTYTSIDAEPLPEALLQRLQQADAGEAAAAPPRAEVIPLRRRWQNQLQRHAALAAGICLALGFGLGKLPGGDQPAASWDAVAEVLEQAPSGTPVNLNDGRRLQARMTFAAEDGSYCRLYRLSDAGARVEDAIACRRQGSWQLQSGLISPARNGYQLASGNAELDRLLDSIMADEPLDPAAEQSLLQNRWQDQL